MTLRQFKHLMRGLMLATPTNLVTTAETSVESTPERGKTLKGSLKHITTLTIFQSNLRQQTTVHAMFANKSIPAIRMLIIVKIVKRSGR